MLHNVPAWEGDKFFSAIGKTVGLTGIVEKVANTSNCRGLKSPIYRIAWRDKNNKILEELLSTDENGTPIILNQVFLLDRDYPIGSKIVDRNNICGTVLAVEEVATLSLGAINKDISSAIKIRDIPIKLLKAPIETEIGGKFLWNEWIGKIKDFTVKVTYRFEYSDVVCSVSGEEKHSVDHQSHNYPFPFVGQEFPSLGLTQLWDADWEDNRWFRNMFQYYGKKAKVVNIEVDSIAPVCIRKVPFNNFPYDEVKERENLPEFLVKEDLEKVQLLNGLEYSNIDEQSLCKYSVQETDIVNFFKSGILSEETVIEYSGSEQNQQNLQINQERIFTVFQIRNKYLIEWSNGVQEFCFVQTSGLSPAVEDPANISLLKPLRPGTIVEINSLGGDYVPGNDTKYGIVLSDHPERIVIINLVTPRGDLEPHFEETYYSRYDVTLSEKYLYLEDLSSAPIVFVQKSLEIGIVTGIDIDAARLEVKLPNGTQIFPYIHDTIHMPASGYNFLGNSPDTQGRLKKDKSGDKHVENIDLEQLSFNHLVNPNGYLISEDLNEEHSFYDTQFSPRMSDVKYLFALEKEIESFKNLPDGIWIQGFVKRSDLFTAVIRGKPETIYEDALLVFDVILPQDFPLVVPEVVFRSFGLEINPKIRTTGEVILPLYSELIPLPNINQNPCIIRTCLSWIQNNILVQDPYYLVCKNGRNSGDNLVDAHAEQYNEFIFLNLLTYHQKMIMNLPPHWDDFVMNYYSERLPSLMMHYESLVRREGHRQEQDFSGSGDSRPTSTGDGFYLSLRSRLDEIRYSNIFRNI